jgi:hypothetical protein
MKPPPKGRFQRVFLSGVFPLLSGRCGLRWRRRCRAAPGAFLRQHVGGGKSGKKKETQQQALHSTGFLSISPLPVMTIFTLPTNVP